VHKNVEVYVKLWMDSHGVYQVQLSKPSRSIWNQILGSLYNLQNVKNLETKF